MPKQVVRVHSTARPKGIERRKMGETEWEAWKVVLFSIAQLFNEEKEKLAVNCIFW